MATNFERPRPSESTPYAVVQKKVLDGKTPQKQGRTGRTSPNMTRAPIISESPFAKSPNSRLD